MLAAMFHALIIAAALDAPTASPVPTTVPSPVVSASASPAAPTRRALPAPLDPEFIGGGGAEFNGPTIGVPSDPGVRVYGWADVGTELSTSKYSNYPLTYDDVPNRVELDQFILRAERQPDTVQTNHFDWGFRVTGLYGVDYRWTTQEGMLSNQLLLRNQTNGFDPVEAYGILYFPKWGQGTYVEVGRYISPPDIEAQLAPNNFLYTHSLMFDFDSYTQTGVLVQTKLSNYWTLEYAIDAGEDIAPWDGSAHTPTGLLLARYVSHSNRNSVLFGINSLSLGSKNGQNFTTYAKGSFINPSTGLAQPMIWGHDNLQQQNVTWTHVFNSGFQNQFEAYYLYQYNAYVGGTVNNYNVATGGPVYLGAGGGIGAFLPGLSSATGFVDYLEYKSSPRDVISFRTDYVNDPRGERSGFATAYGSLTLGLQHKFNSVFMIRPEIRTEKAFRAGVTPYDNGTKGYQSTFGMDAILNFGNP
jgi:Putative beta-barrel porin-2, OmpL-like. bbp2